MSPPPLLLPLPIPMLAEEQQHRQSNAPPRCPDRDGARRGSADVLQASESETTETYIVEVGHGEEFNHTGWFQPQVGPIWHDMLQLKARPRGSSISSRSSALTPQILVLLQS